MSKGSGRRPTSVPKREFDRRWAETFGIRYPGKAIEHIEDGGGGSVASHGLIPPVRDAYEFVWGDRKSEFIRG